VLKLGVALTLTALASTLNGACPDTLRPSLQRDLDIRALRYAKAVAWLNGGHLAIGHRNGIVDYELASGTSRKLVDGSDIPKGLPRVEAVSADRERLVAFNLDYSDVVADVRSGKLLLTRRYPWLQIYDLALRNGRLAVLGKPVVLKTSDQVILRVGEPGARWESFRSFHVPDLEGRQILRRAFGSHGGAVALCGDGSAAMITPGEAGVFRYAADGSSMPTLRPELRELVIRNLSDVVDRYGSDLQGGYDGIFNRQATVDDLIDTPEGLAIVVRQWSAGVTYWELWFPDAKGTRRRVRLGIEDRSPFGNRLQCDTRKEKLACVFERFVKPGEGLPSRLVLFDLSQAKPDPACH
jgi:hypothetical protein